MEKEKGEALGLSLFFFFDDPGTGVQPAAGDANLGQH